MSATPSIKTLLRRSSCLALALLVALPLVEAGPQPAHVLAPAVPLLGILPAGTALNVVPPGSVSAWSNAIGPGTQLAIRRPSYSINTGLCTANWVWKDQSGTLYLGAAGHCFTMEGPEASTHGPDADFNASDVEVYACVHDCAFGGQAGGNLRTLDQPSSAAPQGLSVPKNPVEWVRLGAVAYARQRVGTSQIGNDFGVAEIPAALVSRVDPAMPFWGGPVAPAGSVAAGDHAVLHGNGALMAETFATKSRTGDFTSFGAASWAASVPIAGGDSGAAVGQVPNLGTATDYSDVRAAGIVTHGGGCTVGPETLQSGEDGLKLYCGAQGTTLARAIDMAKEASLCLVVVLQGQDPATSPNGPNCL